VTGIQRKGKSKMKKQEEIKKNKKQRGENVEEIIEIHVVCFKAGLDARGYLMS